jgi:hypothetical protein
MNAISRSQGLRTTHNSRQRFFVSYTRPPPLMCMRGAVAVRGAATKDCQCNSMKRFRNIRFVRQLK